MVSTLYHQEKYNKGSPYLKINTHFLSTCIQTFMYVTVRKSFCFYLDIQEPELSRSISRRLQDMGLREEVFLTPRVTHVVGSRAALSASGAGGSGRGAARCARREGRARADAMLERLRPEPQPAPPQPQAYVHLTVHKAISLLDKLYDTFFKAPRKSHVRLFSKHFIKIEFLDKLCRPVYKEFDEWPQISLEPDPPKEKKEKKESLENLTNTFKNNTAGQKMTRKSRPRIKEREEKETKGGYCEMCNTDYVDAALHRRSSHHLAFVRDHTNFIALDSLISSGADVSTFLDKATPVNGERRSLRKLCNGDAETKNKCSKRSQSHESTVNGNQSPKRNGGLDDERKHNTRCSKRSSESQLSEYRQYYKVVGVSTKLRSSGGFAAKRKDSPTCNGTKPLVVKFKKIRRSELSVLSDEAEQFMFPKRASSTSSSSSSDRDDSGRNDSKEVTRPKRKSLPQPAPATVRQRLARPLALKEESSEEDSWPEDHRKRKKRAPVTVKRGRRLQYKTHVVAPPPKPPEAVIPPSTAPCPEQPEAEISPLREEPTEKCMKWEDGRLKYTPAVEKLEFAFETVPQSEPWFETFKRQDQDKVLTKNVPQYFALYSNSPKLPYEIGQLPPLKPNCCALSDYVKREEKAGPSRSYGTRGMKKQKIKKRTVALMALEHPRKSPREHASTLAILGSAGLLHRRKHAEDAKSTASEETIASDTHSNTKLEPMVTETHEASERMQQFLSEVFNDAAEYDVSDEFMEVGTNVTTSTNIPDVSSLVSECENCDIIRNEIKLNSNHLRTKKGKFKKKNKTGWPNKRKQVRKELRNNSMETEKAESLGRSSIEMPDDESTQDTVTEEDHNVSETEKDDKVIENKDKSGEDSKEKDLATKAVQEFNEPLPCGNTSVHISHQDDKLGSDTSPVKMDLKVVLEDKVKQKTLKSEERECKRNSRSSASETEDKDKCSKKKRLPLAIGDWLQPIVRVSRMEPNSARRLRSAGRSRSTRYR